MLNARNNQLFIHVFSLLAGLMDSMTGLLLILFPEMTLKLMGIPGEMHPPALIGFIGAFVLANGSLYLWAQVIGKRQSPWLILQHIWLVTAWVRICVGLTTGVSVLNGQLMLAWISVPITDLFVAGIQLYWIRSNRFPKDD